MKKIVSLLIIIALIACLIFTASPKGIKDRLSLGLDMIGGVSVVLEADTDASGAELKSIMEQTSAVIEKRINEMGLSEPVIAIENENRIRIELPGAQNAADAIQSIGKTAQLSFITADGNLVVDGSHVKNAVSGTYAGYDASLLGTYVIDLEFDATGASAFEAATRAIMNGEIHSASEQFYDNQIIIMLDNEVISYPMVHSVITGSNCQISGNFTRESASNLAALIRGGALPVTLNEVQTEIVGATLGLGAANSALIGGIIGIALILIIMVVFYRIMGVVADISLLIYILLVAWTMVGLHAVLTLPGIAGIILSIGMAVDSNVIIFSRIREEAIAGKSVRVAVDSGYKRAIATIIDSQITTVIAAIILYVFGTGSVRGFALTLLIGIVASVLTAVVISQLLLNVIAENKKLATAKMFGIKNVKSIGEIVEEEAGAKTAGKYDFVGNRKKFYCIALAVIVIGIGAGLVRGYNLGIDFTGGTMLQLNTGAEVKESEIESVLKDFDIKADIQYAGANNEKVIIKTTSVIDNDLRDDIISAMNEKLEGAKGVQLEQAGLIGPSVGSQLKSNAIKSMLLAAAAILIYVAIRFEWRFGVSAILALCHDAAMLMAFYGLFHVQMNSPFIAGLLIVIGYSINDTIVIFDRIRENMASGKREKAEKLVNRSINQCIGRSVMTSVTTAVSIIPLIVIGSSAIREFTIPLLVGVMVGTVSSICLASNVYLDITKLTKKNRYKGA